MKKAKKQEAPIGPRKEKFQEIQKEIDATKQEIARTLEKTLRRGDQLEDMERKSELLEMESKKYLKNTRKLGFDMYLRSWCCFGILARYPTFFKALAFLTPITAFVTGASLTAMAGISATTWGYCAFAVTACQFLPFLGQVIAALAFGVLALAGLTYISARICFGFKQFCGDSAPETKNEPSYYRLAKK